MEIKINKTSLQAPTDFIKTNQKIYDILTDPLHAAIYINNPGSKDILVFVSSKNKAIENMTINKFKNIFEELNKSEFTNIMSIFENAVLDGPIAEIKVVDSTTIERYKNKKTINNVIVTIEDKILIIHMSQEKPKSIFKERLEAHGYLNPNIFLLYNKLNHHIFIINRITGSWVETETSGFNDCKEEFQNFISTIPQVFLNENKIEIKDIRFIYEFIKERQVSPFVVKQQDSIVYITFIKQPDKYKNISEFSKETYNKPNEMLMNLLYNKLDSRNVYYIVNGNGEDDFLAYFEDKELKHIGLRDLYKDFKFDSCTEISASLPKEKIIDIESYGINTIYEMKESEDDEIHVDKDCLILYLPRNLKNKTE